MIREPNLKELSLALGQAVTECKLLAGDGSDRLYFRLRDQGQKSYVLMSLKGSDQEAVSAGRYEWVLIGEILKTHGISVPRVFARLGDGSGLIIEDHGDLLLEHAVREFAQAQRWEPVRELYGQCVDALGRMLAIRREGASTWTARRFDAERYLWEFRFFQKKYLTAVLGKNLSNSEQNAFDTDCVNLSQFLAPFSQWFVHRDFHSRNVMIVDAKIAILDFQDARLGPAAYDLLSLVYDSYVPLPADLRRQIWDEALATFRQMHGKAVEEEINASWRPLLLQRLIKAIGSFGYLTQDKGKRDYLQYVTPALEILNDVGVADDRWPFLSERLLQMMRRPQDNASSCQ